MQHLSPDTTPSVTTRPSLPPLPLNIQRLPVDGRGYPVPWFVQWIDGKPDFRIMDGQKLVRAVKESRCWICGEPLLGRYRTFVIGPMCAVNRISGEPPSHRACAQFSAQACPFLTLPKAVRREAGLPEERSVAGVMIPRNPGVALLWITKRFQPIKAPGGILFDIGKPEIVEWWTEGRTATRAEVLASIESGLPILEQAAQEEGPEAVAEIARRYQDALTLLPKAQD
jgi:hypothetical protein